jgi:NADPH2:quinone reductase
VNFPDGLMVQGKYQTKPPFPFVPGSEVSGTISAVGADVTEFEVGDRVVAFCGLGAYAEQTLSPANQVYPLPAAIDFVPVAGFLITYGTSYHALKDRARLRAGETLLVLGAAGGVGLTAVELGKAMGARVIACASSADKLALAREYGADETIDYMREDLRTRLKELTGGRGVDVVYDPVGGAHTEAAVRSLAWEGRYLVIGFAAGDIPKVPANLLLLKSADLLGVLWGVSLKHNPEPHAANLRELLDWYAAGRLRPHISETHPLADAVTGLQRVMQRHAQGKVILTVAR